MPPTFELGSRVKSDWQKLSSAENARFREARKQFTSDLEAGLGFRPRLRVKGVQGHPNVFEMTWAPDGRATFEYGSEQIRGKAHIVWRRIGSHNILKNP